MTDELTPEQDAAIATALEASERLTKLFTSFTAGPAMESEPTPAAAPSSPLFVDGWYAKARRMDAHPGRIGGVITPWSIVQHSTDMPPEDWDALLRSIVSGPGAGNAFTFLVGRTAAQGIVQVCPVNRNANHAGGQGHGVYVAGGNTYHPNLVAVGIEAHNAGGLRLVGGKWCFVEDGKVHGAPFDAADVIPDPNRPGRGWHKAPEYQLDALRGLWTDLETVLAPVPAGARTRAFGEAVQPWGNLENARLVTHHQLDPVHRSDPWNHISGAAKSFAASRGY